MASRQIQKMQTRCSPQLIPFRPLSLLFHKPCPIPLPPVRRQNLLHSPAIWIHFPPSLQLIVFLSINASKKKKKITYFVSCIFTYHVYDCLFFLSLLLLLQHFLHHDLYGWGGAAASCCSLSEPRAANPAWQTVIH